MKHYRWLIIGLLGLMFTAPSSVAQSFRLRGLADQLARQASELAEGSYTDYRNSNFSSRNEIDSLFLAQQFSASASMFQRMVRDGRRESELRESMSILSDLSRRADRGVSQRYQWSSVQRTLDDILRELNLGSVPGPVRPGPGRDDEGGRQTGRVVWRGTVDDDIHLVIRNDNIEVRTIGGSEYNNATYNFTSPLPRRRVTVNVTRLKGRGDVRVIQQPSRDNDFSAVIQIRDPSGGARDYEVEITW